jgi:DNA-binding MarR family transcriptional regulator
MPVLHAEESAAALSQSIHRLSRRLRKHARLQLTASQMSALTTVERHGELRLGELGRLEQVGKSTMTRLVSKLADAGDTYGDGSTPPTAGDSSLR